MNNIVYINYKITTIESYTSDEEYGEWYCQYDNEIISATLSKQDNCRYDEFTVDFDTTVGQKIYAMYMTYNSGDTFGHSEGNIEILWCFLTENKVKDICKDLNKVCNDDYIDTLIFKSETDKKVKLSNPVSGYFEDSGYISYVELIVTK